MRMENCVKIKFIFIHVCIPWGNIIYHYFKILKSFFHFIIFRGWKISGHSISFLDFSLHFFKNGGVIYFAFIIFINISRQKNILNKTPFINYNLFFTLYESSIPTFSVLHIIRI